MEDVRAAGGEEEEEERVLVFDQAVEYSNIAVSPIPADVGSLGSSQGRRFITAMLANAGITVGKVSGQIDEDDHDIEFVQIVTADQLSAALEEEVFERVHLVPQNYMLGFQAKFSGQVGWKVRVAGERKPHHSPGHGRAARTTANDTYHEFCNHEVHEIFVPHGGAMRSTVAVSNAVVVTVLFELNEDGTSKWKPLSSVDGHIPVPAVYQRRIDIVYHNRYTARMSVRSIVP